MKSFLTSHLWYKAMLKVWRKSWEPFRIYHLHTFSIALYYKWDVKNGFTYVLQFFSLISDSLGGVIPKLNQYGHRTTLPICIDFFDGFRSCRDDGRYQDGLIKTSKIIVIKIRKTRERIGRYSLTRLGSLSINAQNFGVNTCKFYKKK